MRYKSEVEVGSATSHDTVTSLVSSLITTLPPVGTGRVSGATVVVAGASVVVVVEVVVVGMSITPTTLMDGATSPAALKYRTGRTMKLFEIDFLVVEKSGP